MATISAILLKNTRNQSFTLLIGRPCVTATTTAKFSTESKKNASSGTEQMAKNPLFDPKLTAVKRGTGGRSSFNGIVATVFGSTGFLGKYVCNKLGKMGTQLIMPYRGEPYFIQGLKLVGDLGQVLFLPFDIRDDESIRKSMKYSNVVVNLIGRDWETPNFKFKEVHETAARRIARLARESGVKRLIHLSSLNVAERFDGYIIPGGSKFLTTKYAGEQAVKEEFPNATIIRPADIWGQEDRFLMYYSNNWRRTSSIVPLWDRGEKTIKQPVYVQDVAQGIVNAIKDPESMGKTYDFVGPKRYVLGDLVDYFFAVMRKDAEYGYKRTNMKWDPLFRLRVSIMEKLTPRWPSGSLGWDKMERDHTTDILTGNPKLEDLNVNLTEIESRAEWELKPYRAYSYYIAEPGEFPSPPPPKVAI